jgi:FMN-dependent NADH-azoreductase
MIGINIIIKMKQILHILSSANGQASVSMQLGNAIIEKIMQTYPGSVVKERNLLENQLPYLRQEHVISFFTPAENRTPENREAVIHSDEVIKEVKEADIIVIGAPTYNLGIHSALKTWIDHLVRVGLTFKFNEGGAPRGLIEGKKIYLALASGAVYSEGPGRLADYVEPYLKAILSFIGMSDITSFRAEGLSVPGVKATVLQKAIGNICIS